MLRENMTRDEHINEKYLNKQFTLKCGTVVTVIEWLNAHHVIVEDGLGRRKSCRASRITSGDIAWFKPKLVDSFIGKSFKLNCGVIVVVLPSENCNNILIADEFGNTKVVNKASLIKGEVSWKEFGEGFPVRIGQGFLLNAGIAVTVKEYVNAGNVTIQDTYGTCVKTTLSQLRKGAVEWPVTENEQFAYGKKMVRIGDEYLLNCGITVKIIEYVNTKHVVVEDTSGNRKNTKLTALKRGRVSWKEFGVRTLKKPEISVVGYKYTTVDGVELEVIEFKDSNNITVQDIYGNTRKTKVESVYTKTTKWNQFNKNSWNYLNVDLSGSYVYIVKHGEIVLYIGKGKNARYLHPTSGKSHSVELNRLYFLGIKVEVSIVKECLTDEDARALEIELLKELNPAYNKVI